MNYKLDNIEKFALLREKLKRDRTHSPCIVEFTGLPKSGKTTIIGRLANILERQKLRVCVVEEAASEKVDSKYRSDLFVFNMLCAVENLKNLLQAVTMRGTYDVYIMDRGVYDSVVWCEFLSDSGLLSVNAKRLIQTFLSLEQWFSKIDIVVNIKVSRETYEARSRINSPIGHTVRFNEEYFDILGNAYSEAGKLLNQVQVAIRPKCFDYDSTLKSVTLDDLESDSFVLAESSELYSKIAVEIADKLVLEMYDKSVEKIAIVESSWFNENFEKQLNDKEVQHLALLIFGRPTASLFDEHLDQKFQPKVRYVDRREAEKNPDYLQIVSGAYITNNGRFLVLKRSDAEKRDQLRGKLTLIVSGHVDYEDQGLTYGGKNEIENCLLREMTEELRYFDRPVIRPRFAFRMGDDEMGRRHLGFVYHVSTNSDRLETSDCPGAGDFESTVSWMTEAELRVDIDKFDSWSRLVITHLAFDKVSQLERQSTACR